MNIRVGSSHAYLLPYRQLEGLDKALTIHKAVDYTSITWKEDYIDADCC
ncbi:MAG: hypothetical protein QW416_04190 [Candidatus Nitrosocaldaceae archaeon]